MYSNFWISAAIIATSAGVGMNIANGKFNDAFLYWCIYLITSGIDRQIHLDSQSRSRHVG